jgi:adenylate cyclase
MTLLLLGLWAAAVTLTLGRDRPTARVLLLGLGLLLLALATSALAWLGLGLRLPASALMLTPLLATVGVAAPRWRQEGRERAALDQALSRRLAPALLADLLRQPGQMGDRLGGERCRCVVLFADLVGFTGLSHGMEADALFSLLNGWFAAVARPVLEEGGLVDKFIGDALMAEFGLPRSRGDRQEALAAARAALRMQSALEELNRERKREGLAPLRMGIALHVGEVMAGNLGLPERLEYTAIGGAVNVTSRLEALTRSFADQPVLISGELQALIADHADTVPLGRHELRGWPEPVEVHGLRALRE